MTTGAPSTEITSITQAQAPRTETTRTPARPTTPETSKAQETAKRVEAAHAKIERAQQAKAKKITAYVEQNQQLTSDAILNGLKNGTLPPIVDFGRMIRRAVTTSGKDVPAAMQNLNQRFTEGNPYGISNEQRLRNVMDSIDHGTDTTFSNSVRAEYRALTNSEMPTENLTPEQLDYALVAFENTITSRVTDPEFVNNVYDQQIRQQLDQTYTVPDPQHEGQTVTRSVLERIAIYRGIDLTGPVEAVKAQLDALRNNILATRAIPPEKSGLTLQTINMLTYAIQPTETQIPQEETIPIVKDTEILPIEQTQQISADAATTIEDVMEDVTVHGQPITIDNITHLDPNVIANAIVTKLQIEDGLDYQDVINNVSIQSSQVLSALDKVTNAIQRSGKIIPLYLQRNRDALNQLDKAYRQVQQTVASQPAPTGAVAA